jgi:hypothetical protein
VQLCDASKSRGLLDEVRIAEPLDPHVICANVPKQVATFEVFGKDRDDFTVLKERSMKRTRCTVCLPKEICVLSMLTGSDGFREVSPGLLRGICLRRYKTRQ